MPDLINRSDKPVLMHIAEMREALVLVQPGETAVMNPDDNAAVATLCYAEPACLSVLRTHLVEATSVATADTGIFHHLDALIFQADPHASPKTLREALVEAEPVTPAQRHAAVPLPAENPIRCAYCASDNVEVMVWHDGRNLNAKAVTSKDIVGTDRVELNGACLDCGANFEA